VGRRSLRVVRWIEECDLLLDALDQPPRDDAAGTERVAIMVVRARRGNPDYRDARDARDGTRGMREPPRSDGVRRGPRAPPRQQCTPIPPPWGRFPVAARGRGAGVSRAVCAAYHALAAVVTIHRRPAREAHSPAPRRGAVGSRPPPDHRRGGRWARLRAAWRFRV
jgi:hypothetical protein